MAERPVPAGGSPASPDKRQVRLAAASIAGVGRYDDLVARFTGERVPATGISIGVSRLLNALKQRRAATLPQLVVVLALDRDEAVQEETRNVARAVVRAVADMRSGRLARPDRNLADPRPK